MTDKRKGELMMVVCGVLWSMSGITMKYINWNPLLIVGGRGIFSAAIIFISMKMSGYKLKVSKKSLLGYKREDAEISPEEENTTYEMDKGDFGTGA